MAFTDAMLQGEQYRWPLPHWQVQSDYTRVLRLDYARTELTGINLGVVPVFLPEFPGGDLGPRNRRNSEHMLSATRLHDMGTVAAPQFVVPPAPLVDVPSTEVFHCSSIPAPAVTASYSAAITP